MELSGKYFTYSGTASRQYGLVFAHADTSEVASLAGEISAITIHNKQSKRDHFIGEIFEDSALKFEAEVVTIDDDVIQPCFRRDIEKWLFRQPGYKKLYIDIDCDTDSAEIESFDFDAKQTYLNCRFVNPEHIEGNGGLVGYKFTVVCDSAMAWQDPIEKEFYFTGSSNTAFVSVDTDTNDYVYPKVTFKIGKTGGDISILNLSDDPGRQTSFTDLTPNITFVMNGDGVNYISGGNYAKFSDRNFIRLIDGDNDVSISGDVASIKFEFQNQRYM